MSFIRLRTIVLTVALLAIAGEVFAQNAASDQGGRRGDRGRRSNRSTAVQVQPVQPGDSAGSSNQTPDATRGSGRQRGGNNAQSSGNSRQADRGPGGPGSRWGRGRGPGSMTPQDREQFYGGMVDRYVDRMSSTYELTDDQKPQVRSKLDEIKTEQLAYSQKTAQEYDSIHAESHQLRDAERDGGQVDKQRQQQVEQRLQELRQNSPLMNPERITQEVEKLLPAAQVERGRARREAEHQQWQQRREQMRQQMAQRRQQPAQAGDSAVPAEPPATAFSRFGLPGNLDPGAASQPSDRGGRGSFRDRFSSRGSRGRRGVDVRGARGDRPDDAGEAVTGERRERTLIPENPISPWEQYIRDFIRTYNLDEAQQATAWSIYREMQERRVAHEQTHRVDYEDARKIEDSGQREQKVNELNKTIVGLFDELKLRLTRIPSTAQRIAVEGRSTASQPA